MELPLSGWKSVHFLLATEEYNKGIQAGEESHLSAGGESHLSAGGESHLSAGGESHLSAIVWYFWTHIDAISWHLATHCWPESYSLPNCPGVGDRTIVNACRLVSIIIRYIIIKKTKLLIRFHSTVHWKPWIKQAVHEHCVCFHRLWLCGQHSVLATCLCIHRTWRVWEAYSMARVGVQTRSLESFSHSLVQILYNITMIPKTHEPRGSRPCATNGWLWLLVVITHTHTENLQNLYSYFLLLLTSHKQMQMFVHPCRSQVWPLFPVLLQ